MLIIGGSRFIGLHLVRHLAALEDEVTVFNRGESAQDDIYPAGVIVRHGDRNDPTQLAEAITGEYSAVFDICAYTPQQAQGAVDAFRDRTNHYLYCSSTACYLPADRYPIREDAARGRGPIWGDYGADKAASEDLLLASVGDAGFPVTIFRPQWVYGPGDYQRLASAFIDEIVQHGLIEIPFDGDYCLNWCYALDLVAAMELATRKPSAIGKAYNVVGDEIMTTTGMIRACAAAAYKDVEIVRRPELKGKKGFSVQPIHLIVDNTAVKRDLGLCPTPIDDGLRYTAEWLEKDRS